MTEKGKDIDRYREKVILLAVDINDGTNVEASLDELAELADTTECEVVDRMIQTRDSIHPGTYIGKGKIEEVAELVSIWEADTIICDDELSPAQMSNLSDALDIKVIDRTVLILDIFASHARTSEGKLQVELAQLRYRSSHLMGMGRILSRLGGGIGTRGPGETKLESDRRQIRERISMLDHKLKDVKRHRDIQRAERTRSRIPTVAIVGYTNSGKSTLLNYLTDADVLSENKLFATLDTTTRSLTTDSGQQLLFTDTVGFINKLPHTVIKAFRSTLEEAGYADILLHVVDITNPDYEKQMKVVYDTLGELDIADKPVITAYNKIDLLKDTDYIHSLWTKRGISKSPVKPDELDYLKDPRSGHTVHISAHTGEGTDKLLRTIEDVVNDGMQYIDVVLPFDRASIIQQIRSNGKLMLEDYTNDGIHVEAMIPSDMHKKIYQQYR